MTILYTGIIIAALLYYILQPATEKKQNCRVARAGDVTHSTPLVHKINNLANKTYCFDGKEICFSDYEVFIVEGESMSPCGIHTGNGLLVERLFEKSRLRSGAAVVYEIDPRRYTHDHPEAKEPQYGYKIRQFLAYADLSLTNEDIYAQVAEIDTALQEENMKLLLLSKLDKARKYLPGRKVTLSITYREAGKDYSVHSLEELYGEVKYIIPEEYIRS